MELEEARKLAKPGRMLPLDADGNMSAQGVAAVIDAIKTLAAALDAANEAAFGERVKRVNEYAHAGRLVAWLQNARRPPANAAFTEGPERQVAYASEEAIACLLEELAKARASARKHYQHADDGWQAADANRGRYMRAEVELEASQAQVGRLRDALKRVLEEEQAQLPQDDLTCQTIQICKQALFSAEPEAGGTP